MRAKQPLRVRIGLISRLWPRPELLLPTEALPHLPLIAVLTGTSDWEFHSFAWSTSASSVSRGQPRLEWVDAVYLGVLPESKLVVRSWIAPEYAEFLMKDDLVAEHLVTFLEEEGLSSSTSMDLVRGALRATGRQFLAVPSATARAVDGLPRVTIAASRGVGGLSD